MMPEQILTRFLGRPPRPEDRAIFADQMARLAAVYANPLLPAGEDLQRQPPVPEETP